MAVYLKQFETQAAYEAAESGLILPNVSLTLDNNTVHYKPWVDPCISEKVETTYEWVEIGSLKWATKNVGAKTITDYGQYFSWGGVNGFTADQVRGGCKEFSWTDYEYGNGTSSPGNTGMTKYNSTDHLVTLEASDDAATVNMGSGWRIPTKDDYASLGNAVNTAWTEDYQGTGVAGLVCTAKTDSSKVLFFPAAGSCKDGSIVSVDSLGFYWSSSLDFTGVQSAYYLYFNNSLMYWHVTNKRYPGFLVRAVVNE